MKHPVVTPQRPFLASFIYLRFVVTVKNSYLRYGSAFIVMPRHYVAKGLSARIYAAVNGLFYTTIVENEVLPVFLLI